MQPFRTHQGIVAPIDRANIDTDAIIPKQFLKRIERSGFGQFLFYDWRFNEDGSTINDFLLAKEPYSQASVLVAGPNFGCGSSREHAPWALLDYGFRVIISSSYADIFFNNCFNNGILPIVLPAETVDRLLKDAQNRPGMTLNVDLEEEVVIEEEGTRHAFTVDPYRKMRLLNGFDDIGLTLQHESDITRYEASHA
jgi:3-isopropylmalate/(R)-2-methylmalate dehydratase small subunit